MYNFINKEIDEKNIYRIIRLYYFNKHGNQ